MTSASIFRVGVREEFSAPLGKLQAALQRVALNDSAENVRKDGGEAGRAVEKVAGSFNGFTPLLTGIGAGSRSAASALGLSPTISHGSAEAPTPRRVLGIPQLSAELQQKGTIRVDDCFAR